MQRVTPFVAALRGTAARLGGYLAIAAVVACARPAASSLPDEYLGRWYYTGSSGGITGRGMNDSATGYIEIRANDTIEEYREDGTRTGSAAFSVTRGPTIFSSDARWILTRGDAAPEVITLSGDGRSMTLAENVYDGFQRSYVRAR
jgi:hypothetical protein